MATIYDQRYIRLIEHLTKVRKNLGVTQAQLAKSLTVEQSMISKVEGIERRLDVIELSDWLFALGYDRVQFLRSLFLERLLSSWMMASQWARSSRWLGRDQNEKF